MRALRPALGLAKTISVAILLAAIGIGAYAMWVRTAPNPVTRSTVGAGRVTASQAQQGAAATIDLAPADPADEPAGNCTVYISTYDRLPMTAKRTASISTSVVVGTVEEVGPARWRTADEKAPSEQQDLGGDVVMRMLRILVDENLAGAKTDRAIVAWIEGGAIGCHEFQVDDFPLDINAGDRFTFFLDTDRNPLATIAGVPRVVQMWPVNGDTVTTAAEGKVSVAMITVVTNEALRP